jgi:hypothetical protein
MMLLMEWRV